MASASSANVIVLQSHPTWIAVQRRARERTEAMRRHPSFSACAAMAQGELGHRVYDRD